MERKDKACWNCGNYKPYYTKGFCRFNKKDVGFCIEQRISVDKHDQCKCWTHKQYFRYQKDSSLRSLDEILKQLSEVRQILVEDKEERENLK